MTADGTHAPPGFSHPDAPPGGIDIPLSPGAPAPDGLPQEAALQAELDDMRDRWMRSEAEVANVRARAKRDVEDARQYAVQRFATDVVEAAENLRRGLDSLPAPSPSEPEIIRRLRDGIAGIERSFTACRSATASTGETRPVPRSTRTAIRRCPGGMPTAIRLARSCKPTRQPGRSTAA